MTFLSAAYAINGPELGASFARLAEFADTGGAEGVVLPGDLKVTALAVPGVGVNIATGSALILNRYQSTPRQTYVVDNPGVHTLAPGDMPGSSPSARSFILAVVVGDPDFSQTGHPWMVSPVPEGEETSFEYVRPTLIQVSAGATSLNVNYPALPIARIDIPANTTTITNAMITDLTHLARPRSSTKTLIHQPPAETGDYTQTSFASLTAYAPQVAVPHWAKRAEIITTIQGIGIGIGKGAGNWTAWGQLRQRLGSIAGLAISYDETVPDPTRRGYTLVSGFDVSGIAGTNAALIVQILRNGGTTGLRVISGMSIVHDIRFFEE